MCNQTFYELQTKQAHYYKWSAAEANRGANDATTCIVKFRETLDGRSYQKIILNSDTCGGQNRNRHLINAIISLLERIKNFTSVEQKYFESNHSSMEFCSMHNSIEDNSRPSEIERPSDHMSCMKSARKQGDNLIKLLRYVTLTSATTQS